MPRVPKKENFTLKKAKLLKGGGMEIHYASIFTEDGDDQVHGETVSITKHDRRHPDVDEAAGKLKKHLLHGAGHLSVVNNYIKKLSPPDKKSFEASKKKLLEVEFENTAVTTVSYSGADHMFGVIISGSYKSFQGSKVALNTPRIVFSQDAIGIEKEVEELCEALSDECYEFLFNSKQWQPEIDFNAPKDLPPAKHQARLEDQPKPQAPDPTVKDAVPKTSKAKRKDAASKKQAPAPVKSNDKK